jgi:hypothetical protein
MGSLERAEGRVDPMSIYSRLNGQKTVAWISIASLPACLAAIYSILAAVDFDGSLGYLPVEAIEVAHSRLVFSWAVFDFLGYYMLRVPLILFLWQWLRPRNPVIVDFASACGLLYVILAVAATSVLTGATTAILALYPDADAAMRIGLEAAWEASVGAVRQGLWHFMLLPWLVWGCVMGSLLAEEDLSLGRALQLVGLASALGSIAPFFASGIEATLSLADEFQVHYMPLWMAWAGIVLLRRPNLIDPDK